MLSITIDELKSLLGEAFDSGCSSYKDLKIEFVERIVESHLSRASVSHYNYDKCNQSSLLTVSPSAISAIPALPEEISVSSNVISNYYYYTDGFGTFSVRPDSEDEINL